MEAYVCEVEVTVEVEWMDVVFLQRVDLLTTMHLSASLDYYFLLCYRMLPIEECTQQLYLDPF